MKWALVLAMAQEFCNAAPTVLEHHLIGKSAVTLTQAATLLKLAKQKDNTSFPIHFFFQASLKIAAVCCLTASPHGTSVSGAFSKL